MLEPSPNPQTIMIRGFATVDLLDILDQREDLLH